jgi:hypothetical protein
MADIINLNKARKRLKKGEKAEKAAVNRSKYSRSTSQKRLDKDPTRRFDRNLDQSKLNDDDK